MSTPPREAAPESAIEALSELLAAIDDCVDRLHEARDRAEELVNQRHDGRSWLQIVSAETRPLVVETISAVLSTLSRAGSAWRREEALALRAENVSINRIAGLFGVTRQRISALLRERGAADDQG